MTSNLPGRALRRLAATDRAVAARLRRRAGLGGVRRPADGGFVLLETVVAISLIVLVMAAFSTFFVNTVSFTSLQRAAQAATSIANSRLEIIRALPVSDLVKGRDTTSVDTQVRNASATVTGWLTGMAVGSGAAVDPTAALGSGATALLPTTATPQTLNGIVFNTAVYLGNCALPTGLTLSATCIPSTVTTGYLRVVVAVTWSGPRCGTAGCSYATATLVSTADDPLFNLNQTPPAAPSLVNPGNQTTAVGETVSLAVVVSAVPSYRVTATAGTLPAGLVLDTATGRITGSPVTIAAATPLTLTVTDGFGRTAATSFTWTVIAPLTATAPAGQSGVIGTPVSTLTLTAAGGTTPYTWSDPGASLPAGLSLTTSADTGVVTGTPTTYGVFPVSLRVVDAAGRQATVTFSWNIDYPPFAATNPGPQKGTVGVATTLQLGATGGSGSFSWAGGGTLPTGMSMTAAGLISGTPSTVGTASVSLTATDTVTGVTRAVAFTWTLYARPAVTAPAAQQSLSGAAVSLQLAYSCPNAPCTFRVDNGPATLGVSAGGLVTGTVTSGAQTFAAASVTIIDSAGVAVTSGTFSWTVTANAPNAPQAVAVVNGDGSATVSWTAPSGTTVVTGYTVTLRPGGGTCSTTGALTCTVSGLTNGAVYAVTVTANSGSGISPASAAVRAIPYPAVMSAANGLTLWLDAADPTMLVAGSGCTGAAATTAVGCWKDKSGGALHFSQTTAANQPGVATWNGLSAVNFADTTDVLNSVAANGVFQTVFVAANVTNTGQWINLFGQANADYNVRIGSGIGRNKPYGNDWSFNSSGTGNLFDWANGAQGASAVPPGAVITTDQAVTTKSFAASVSSTVYGRGLVGQVGDVITFNRALTTAERRSVEEYLARKWGVAITPQAPTSVTARASNNGNGANNGGAVVGWAPPAFDGGSPVTGYTVTASPGGKTCTTTTTSCTVLSLTRDVTYTFTVTAANAVGIGPGSAVSPSVTP